MIEIHNQITELPWHPTRRWGARDLTKINKIVVHQELGEASVKNVNNYHINPNHISEKGCPHFCYHYGIEKDGKIIQANELSSITWHVSGENTNAIGIMVVGNFDGPGYNMGSSEPQDEQIKSLDKLIDYLLKAFNLSNQDLYGHCHFGKPACPGNILQKWVENRRELSTETETTNEKKTLERVQEKLNKLGYEAGKVDGIHGIKTLKAIRRFQKDNQLKTDGVVGPKTWKKLVELTS